jgi:hypothetical protein
MVKIVDVILIGDSWVRMGNTKTWPEEMCTLNNWTFINIGLMGGTSKMCVAQMDTLQTRLDELNYATNENTLWLIRHGGNDLLIPMCNDYNLSVLDTIKIFKTKYGNMNTRWLTKPSSFYTSCAHNVSQNTTNIMEIAKHKFNALNFLVVLSPVSNDLPICNWVFTVATIFYSKIISDTLAYIMHASLYRELAIFKNRHNSTITMFDETPFYSSMSWTWDGFHLRLPGVKKMAIESSTYNHKKNNTLISPSKFKKDQSKLHQYLSIKFLVIGSSIIRGLLIITPITAITNMYISNCNR